MNDFRSTYTNRMNAKVVSLETAFTFQSPLADLTGKRLFILRQKSEFVQGSKVRPKIFSRRLSSANVGCDGDQ